jgi:hypothetical protein
MPFDIWSELVVTAVCGASLVDRSRYFARGVTRFRRDLAMHATLARLSASTARNLSECSVASLRPIMLRLDVRLSLLASRLLQHGVDRRRLNAELGKPRQMRRCNVVALHECDLVACERSSGHILGNTGRGMP